jgi:hypothetical protein
LGPLVGVLIGGLLTRSAQRRQWLADHKRAEYRELLSVLSGVMGDFPALMDPRAADRDKELYKLRMKVVQKIQDSIFIAEKIDEIGIFPRLQLATEKMVAGGSGKDLGDAVSGMMITVRTAALEDISEMTLFGSFRRKCRCLFRRLS